MILSLNPMSGPYRNHPWHQEKGRLECPPGPEPQGISRTVGFTLATVFGPGKRRSNEHTLWLFNIAMGHGPFIDGLPIKNGDFPWLYMLKNQIVTEPLKNEDIPSIYEPSWLMLADGVTSLPLRNMDFPNLGAPPGPANPSWRNNPTYQASLGGSSRGNLQGTWRNLRKQHKTPEKTAENSRKAQETSKNFKKPPRKASCFPSKISKEKPAVRTEPWVHLQLRGGECATTSLEFEA